MNPENLATLSDHELLQAYKKQKSYRIIGAVLIGSLLGISSYGFFKYGFSLYILFPLFFAFLLFTKKDNFKEFEAEVKTRKLL